MQRRSVFKLLAGLALPGTSAFAQSGSGKPIRIVVPLSVGTGTDTVTRLIAPKLSAILGQPIIVENKAGGNGIIGIQEVVRAAPDGRTLLMGSSSPLSINVALTKNLPYDPRRDLTAIAGFNFSNHALMVKSSSPVRTLQDFIALAKQKELSVGYSTSLVQMQIAALAKAGLKLLPVPYKGTPPTITDVIGESLSATLMDPGNALPQIKSGQMRGLAVTSVKRNPHTPDIPAMSETLAGYDFPAWTAMVGPAGMKRETVAKINAALVSALKQKDVFDKFALAATNPFIMTPDELKGLIESDIAKWLKMTKEAGIQPE